ncbi:MAG: hypothetical protein ABSD21_10450 [Rhizomicrobium sp.]
MSRQLQAISRPAAKSSAGRTVHTLVVSFLGLLPIGFASGLMLMQILGVWAY